MGIAEIKWYVHTLEQVHDQKNIQEGLKKKKNKTGQNIVCLQLRFWEHCDSIAKKYTQTHKGVSTLLAM